MLMISESFAMKTSPTSHVKKKNWNESSLRVEQERSYKRMSRFLGARGREAGGRGTELIFAGYVPLASPSPFPIIGQFFGQLQTPI